MRWRGMRDTARRMDTSRSPSVTSNALSIRPYIASTGASVKSQVPPCQSRSPHPETPFINLTMPVQPLLSHLTPPHEMEALRHLPPSE
jgi:hypothetical protein